MLKFFIKKQFSTVKSIPSPPIKPGLLNKITGHLTDITKHKEYKNSSVAIFYHKKIWQEESKSKTFLVRMINKKIVFCNDFNVYKEIFGPKQDHFTNSVTFKNIFGFFFPNSVIVVDGEQWVKLRKVIQRVMVKQSLDRLIPIIYSKTSEVMRNPSINETSTMEALNQLNFDIFNIIMYNWDSKAVSKSEESNEILRSCNKISESISLRRVDLPLLWYLPTKRNREINQRLDFLKKFIEKFVTKYKQAVNQNSSENPADRTHLEEAIIASLEEGSQLSKDELIDYVGTLFFAAYDTSSTNLLYTLYFIAKYPHYQDKLREEIKERFPLGVEGVLGAKMDDVLKLPFLHDFMNEVNRLHTIASGFARTCLKDVVIQDYQIKKGYEVFIDNTLIGLDKDYWQGMEDLEEFRPERWQEFTPPTIKRVMPFGFGGRICPGKNFAIAELKTILVFILAEFRVSLRNPEEGLKLTGQLGVVPDISVNFYKI